MPVPNNLVVGPLHNGWAYAFELPMKATGKKNVISSKACSLLRRIYRLHRRYNRLDQPRDRQGLTLQQLGTARYGIVLQDPHSGVRSQGSVPAFDRSAACIANNYTLNHRQRLPGRILRGLASNSKYSSPSPKMLRAKADWFFWQARQIWENRCHRWHRMRKSVRGNQRARHAQSARPKNRGFNFKDRKPALE